MAQTEFKGIKISSNDVLKALEAFNKQYPSSEYKNWLYNESYKFALKHDNKFYPPKYILSQITGISLNKFSGGEQTNNVFLELGFDIVDKPTKAKQ
jgi:5-methylcytosine-specific restriction enzyme B